MKAIRQREIIKTFYKVAKKEGLENASLAKTAKAMHINPSLIVHYFPSKDDLIYGLIDYILDKYVQIFRVHPRMSGDPKTQLFQIIDNIFSKKWNTLFDDGVSYSCYSLTFRDKKVRRKYRNLLDTLRQTLEQLIRQCMADKVLKVDDPASTADLIFILVDGAYYYLSLVEDKMEYNRRLTRYKQRALQLLNLTENVISKK